MLVPFITVDDINDSASVGVVMQDLPENEISCVNWPDMYPSSPKVSFKIAHNGSHLFLQYFVEENEVLAKTEKDNGPVWTDSCVEFFISFDDTPSYYNMEFSCIGKALLGYRKDRKDVEHADEKTMNSILRYPSLGTDTFEKRQGDFRWNMLIVIPISVFWKSGLSSFQGIRARGNFYKCGDDLSVPHFLSWQPIQSEKPNFHLPAFFGRLDFE
ncbi:MAG: carbohydrate-binding family 9-like protein [Dysgonomonas sp.]|nr:carbohydrate-binding family 9-like protein [Dysgonomonas sp.]